MGDKGKKKVGPAHCRGCGKERSRAKSETAKIGGFRYHPECAEKRPKARQRWDENLGWVRL